MHFFNEVQQIFMDDGEAMLDLYFECDFFEYDWKYYEGVVDALERMKTWQTVRTFADMYATREPPPKSEEFGKMKVVIEELSSNDAVLDTLIADLGRMIGEGRALKSALATPKRALDLILC